MSQRALSAVGAIATDLARVMILLPAAAGLAFAVSIGLAGGLESDRLVPAIAFGLVVTSIVGLVVGPLPDPGANDRGPRLAALLLLTGVGIGLWFASGAQQIVGLGLILATGLHVLLARLVPITRNLTPPSASS